MKNVSFGAAGMSDYTLHKDPERKERYISRHKKTKTGQKQELKLQAFMQSMCSGINQP